jgi:hypothetical protein
MQVDGSVVMWAFGMVFVAFTGLVGVIWAMLNKRISTVESAMDKIFDELKADRRASGESDQKILDKISLVHESIGKLAVSSGERKAECVAKFATKDELNLGLSSVRAQIKG